MATIEERLQAMEDRLAIYQLVCGYGYAVDGCNAAAVGRLFAEDAVYAVGDLPPFEGREAIAAITRSAAHLGFVAEGCGHVSTLPHVVIAGDRATATCHTMLVRKVADGGWCVGRLSASRLDLSRTADGWRIDRRQNYLQDGGDAGPALLARMEEGPAAA